MKSLGWLFQPLIPIAPSQYVAVVTETGPAAPGHRIRGNIWAVLARRYWPSVVLLEHLPGTRVGGRGEDPRFWQTQGADQEVCA